MAGTPHISSKSMLECRKPRFGIFKSWFLEIIWLYQQCSDQRKVIDQVCKKVSIHLIAKYNFMVHIY